MSFLTKTLLLVDRSGSTQWQSTASRLEVVTDDRSQRSFDKASVKQLGQLELPRNITAAPTSYAMIDRQSIIVVTRGPVRRRG